MTTFSDDIAGSLVFTVTWEKDDRTHREVFTGRKVNPVNDVFPRGMRDALEGKSVGDSITLEYEPRYCIPRFKEKLVKTLPIDRLRPKTRDGRTIIPLKGRFYPQGHINGLLDVYPDTLTPFRLTELTDTTFTADCNHPLANLPITITATIESLEPRGYGTYGSLTHWREATCDWGPGMQAKLNGGSTNFFHSDFFQKVPSDEATPPSPALDTQAQRNIASVHKQFIKHGMRILDTLEARASGTYDALTTTQELEYSTNPVKALCRAAAHLPPGAPVIAAFGEEYALNNVIQGWVDLHPFERMGLVLEYFEQAGLDHNAGTVSFRNGWRDRDDPFFLEKKGVSDSVYLVYGHKRG